MDKDIAIIIPTLNEERFIARCLDSLIVQTVPFETMDVMVIDGGSRDRTEAIVAAYAQRYVNIRFLHNEKKIQSAAFNVGVACSTATFIVRLDAHALYDKSYVERCVDGLKVDRKRGNVGGGCTIEPTSNTLWAKANAILNHSRFGIGGASFRVGQQACNTDSVPFGAFRREVVEQVGGMREDLPRAEDNEYNSRLRKAGYVIFFDPAIRSTYFARPTLKASCRQMFANGESIGHLFYVDRQSIGLRHVVPLLFVSCIVLGAVLSLVCPLFAYAFFGGMAFYLLCDLLASAVAVRSYGWQFFLHLSLLFFCVHVSYGCGTLKGFVTGRKLRS